MFKSKSKKNRLFPEIFLSLGILFLGNLVFIKNVSAATYYVRPDGGTAEQCTGLVDAPYSGSGTGQSCAWNHLFEALGVKDASNYPVHISGGDTVIVKSGSYRMGYAAGVYDSQSCSSSWPYDCVMNSPPAGIDENHPTRILGEGWDEECSNPPELYGVEKSKQVITLLDTSNIELQCLEITDHENCSTNNNLSSSVPKCNTSFPYGDWAQKGIEFRNVNNLYVKNLNIHGLTGPGIRGAEITDFTMEKSRISYNNAGGLNGETPGASPNQFYGTMNFDQVDISWNGCVENYPNNNTIVDGSCVGGNNGGYGDGVGLAETGGTWHWNNCSFIGNVEDGLDMLYMRTQNGQSYVQNSFFEHNGGNDLKTGGSTVIKNNVLIGDCNYFNGKPIDGNVVHCRGNATLSITLQENNSSATIINNSLGGNSDIMISASSSAAGSTVCDGSERIYIANNIFRGGTHFQLPDTKKVDSYYFHDTCSGFESTIKNNVFFNNKDGVNDCVNSMDSICADPLYKVFDEENDLYNFDIQNNSPAIDAGLSAGTSVGYNTAVTTIPDKDYNNIDRQNVDIGAYEHLDNTTIIRADVDQSGSINSIDAMLTLRNSLGLDMSQTNWFTSATTGDVNCDGVTNSTDAMLILRHSLGLDMSGTGWCVE